AGVPSRRSAARSSARSGSSGARADAPLPNARPFAPARPSRPAPPSSCAVADPTQETRDEARRQHARRAVEQEQPEPDPQQLRGGVLGAPGAEDAADDGARYQ